MQAWNKVRIPELLYIDEDEYLISVAMNRRHLTEGQKAVLANEYMKGLSKKRESEAGKKEVTIREIKRGNIDEETVSPSYEEQERSRKKASNKFNKGNISSGTVADKIN